MDFLSQAYPLFLAATKNKRLSNFTLRRLGLLVMLYEATEPVRMRTLAYTLRCSASSVTRFADHAPDLITRVQTGKGNKGIKLAISDDGRALLNSLFAETAPDYRRLTKLNGQNQHAPDRAV